MANYPNALVSDHWIKLSGAIPVITRWKDFPSNPMHHGMRWTKADFVEAVTVFLLTGDIETTALHLQRQPSAVVGKLQSTRYLHSMANRPELNSIEQKYKSGQRLRVAAIALCQYLKGVYTWEEYVSAALNDTDLPGSTGEDKSFFLQELVNQARSDTVSMPTGGLLDKDSKLEARVVTNYMVQAGNSNIILSEFEKFVKLKAGACLDSSFFESAKAGPYSDRAITTQPNPQTVKQRKSAMKIQELQIKVEDVKMLNGIRFSEYSDDNLIALIADAEAEIERMNKIKNKPAVLKKRIAELEDGIKAIVELMDSRK